VRHGLATAALQTFVDGILDRKKGLMQQLFPASDAPPAKVPAKAAKKTASKATTKPTAS
jgi:ribosome assembly protein YihI (activator of Der GTPase)